MRSDWNDIKTEYVNGSSYSELARKYAVSISTLTKRGSAEKWTELRKKARKNLDTKIVESVVAEKLEMLTVIHDAANSIISQIRKQIADSNPGETINSIDLLHYTKALLTCMHILDIRNALDIEEQEARIAKLRKDAKEETEADRTIRVVMDSELEQYSS